MSYTYDFYLNTNIFENDKNVSAFFREKFTFYVGNNIPLKDYNYIEGLFKLGFKYKRLKFYEKVDFIPNELFY